MHSKSRYFIHQESGMRVFNHGPLYRRPFWVNVWLKRIHSRGQAVFFTWFSVVASVALFVFGFWDYRAWIFAALFLHGGFWITLATWWVDKQDRWD